MRENRFAVDRFVYRVADFGYILAVNRNCGFGVGKYQYRALYDRKRCSFARNVYRKTFRINGARLQRNRVVAGNGTDGILHRDRGSERNAELFVANPFIPVGVRYGVFEDYRHAVFYGNVVYRKVDVASDDLELADHAVGFKIILVARGFKNQLDCARAEYGQNSVRNGCLVLADFAIKIVNRLENIVFGLSFGGEIFVKIEFCAFYRNGIRFGDIVASRQKRGSLCGA